MTFVLPAAIGTFLVVNLICACVALGVGFAAGACFFGAKMVPPASTTNAPKKSATKPQQPEVNRSAERATMAATQVVDLAQNVVSDVGDHAAKMQAISNDLAGIDRQSAGANAAVSAAMDKILAANAQLQEKLAKAEQKLEVQAAEIKAHESEARTDSLTGLANRRAFDDELKRRFSEWQRKNTPCSLALLDIDFFKKFNDTHGHQVGDEVLKQVAKVLQAQSREYDLPCRYGGEEFGVVLANTDAVAACKVAERIRAAIEASTTVCGSKSLKVTCSLGVAQFFANDEVTRLIRRADDALYASKKAGRNCGHWNTGATHVPITAPEQALPAEEVEPAVEEIEETTTNGVPLDQQSPTGATFVQMLKRRVAESYRFGLPLSVICLKLEDYEAMNRKHGSAAARQLIDRASPIVEKGLREMDVMAKLENGEFVIMLPGNTQFEAERSAKRIAAAADSCSLSIAGTTFQLQFCYGIGELRPHDTAQELLARARQDLAAAAVATRAATA
jgi:diguanylate cyclase